MPKIRNKQTSSAEKSALNPHPENPEMLAAIPDEEQDLEALYKPVFVSKQPDYASAAIAVFHIGWTPIPLIPGTTEPAMDPDTWRGLISEAQIRRYWQAFPGHELGVIGTEYTAFHDAEDLDEEPIPSFPPTLLCRLVKT